MQYLHLIYVEPEKPQALIYIANTNLTKSLNFQNLKSF